MELIPSSTVATIGADLGANVSSTVASLWPVLLVVAAVPFAFYIIRKIITLIPKR
jgi:hypothetical protein